jgi:hypothetical protein
VLRKVFTKRRPGPVVVPPLTREQLDEVRQRVLEVAAQRGLSDEQARAVADVLVARLALPVQEDDAEGPARRDGSAGSPPSQG